MQLTCIATDSSLAHWRFLAPIQAYRTVDADLVKSILSMYGYQNARAEDLNRTTCEAKETAGWRTSIPETAGVR